jgi:hypothetical protein
MIERHHEKLDSGFNLKLTINTNKLATHSSGSEKNPNLHYRVNMKLPLSQRNAVHTLLVNLF